MDQHQGRMRERVLSGHTSAAPGLDGEYPRVKPHPIRREISASWRRVRAGGLLPGAEPQVAALTPEQLEQRRRAGSLAPLVRPLSACLEPVVDDSLLVVIGDVDGRVLWRFGGPAARRRADRLGFVSGSAWTEGNVGTNAIGTCLVLDEPVHVAGAEHYVDSHTSWSCAAAPIHDPWSGRLLGVVDISGPAGRVSRDMLGVVRLAARVAELEVRTRQDAALSRLRAQAAPVLAALSGPALAVDPSGQVAAVVGLIASERLALPSDLTTRTTWLPTLGSVVVEPLPGGWLVRPDRGRPVESPTRLLLDLTGERAELVLSSAAHHWRHALSRRHAEILLALILHPEGRSAADLALDLFADPGPTVTVRAEMSRLRRVLGPLLATQPYRIDATVDTELRLPAAGPVIAGSSAPVASSARPPAPLA